MESFAENIEKNDSTWKKSLRKIRNISLLVIIVGLLIWGGIYFYYPYGEGVKSGQLNFVVYKGVVFKTYEGKLIQAGIYSDTKGGIQSNEFEFSVQDKAVAEQLMLAGGKAVELHYKEYFGAIPWRGYSKYIVDKIIAISDDLPANQDQSPVSNLPTSSL